MTYSDNFDSERWLTRGTLQGQWQRGNWNFTPSASIAYIEEKTDAYRDGLGVDIPSIKSTLGQLKFGPEIAYRHLYSDGSSIEPRLKVEAIWNFTQSANVIADEPIAGIDDWRGRTELGLKMQSASGIALDISGGYDGIGSSSYHAVIGRAMVRVPLN